MAFESGTGGPTLERDPREARSMSPPPIHRRWKQALFHSAFFRAPHPDAPEVVRRFRLLARDAFAWLVGDEVSTPARRLRAVAPLIASVRAAALAATRGGAAAALGVSRLEQFRSMRRLESFGVRPTDYHRFALHQIPISERPYAVSYMEGTAVQKYLHRDADRLAVDDKLRLATTLRTAGLRAVGSIAVVAPQTEVESIAEALPDADLFVKRRDLGWGVGAMRFLRMRDRDAWCDGRGIEFDRRSLAAALITESERGEFLIQRRLATGGSVAQLAPDSLATLRIVTLRPRAGVPPALLDAVLRMPARAGAITDNFAGGGVAAPILDAEGLLGSGCTNAMQGTRLPTHPLTRARIEGHRITEFGAAVRLALAAHALFPDILSVGWDVAILDDGPTIVEGNIAWCPELMQQVHQRMLLRTPYGEACARAVTSV